MLRMQENSQLDCLLGGRLVQTMVRFFLAHLNNISLDHFKMLLMQGNSQLDCLLKLSKVQIT